MMNIFNRLKQRSDAEITSLRQKIAEQEEEIERLRGLPDFVQEMELTVKNGRFDMRLRAEFVRALAICAFDVFRKDKGVNFLEMTVCPPEELAGPTFGTLLITFQRSFGMTPGELYGKFKHRIDARFRQIKPEDAQPGETYHLLLTKETEGKKRWHEATVLYGGGYGNWFQIDNASIRADGPLIAEVWELLDPFKPRREFLPQEGKRYYFVDETIYTRPTDFEKVRRNESAHIGKIPKGSICSLRHVGNEWRVMVQGCKEPVFYFNADGSEIPAFLAPYETPTEG